MAVTGASAPRTSVADALEARRDELVDAAWVAISSRLPAYRDAAPDTVADVLGHIRTHHDLLCAVLRRGRPPEPRELHFAGRQAALRARRGIPLAEFLGAFRCYHGIVWVALVEAARDAGAPAEDALAAAGTLLRYVDVGTEVAGDAFLEARQLLVADSDRVRRDLLDDLLAGRGPQTAAGVAAAREAGLHGAVSYVVVTALPTAPPEDESALRRAANALQTALRDARSAPLAVTRHGEIVLVRAIGDGARPALATSLERACADAPTRALALGIGVSTVRRGLATVGDAYHEASLALRRVAATGGVLSLADIAPFDYLTLGGDAVARRMIDPAVERFVTEDRARGGTLIRTLIAYAEADLNAKAAAEALLIHVNTAHHRLGRIAERTGRDLRRLSDVIDLLIAIRITGGPQ